METKKNSLLMGDSSEEDSSSISVELVLNKEKETQNKADLEREQNVYNFDTETIKDKPWLKPGADITDYFNYGFTERTWLKYCELQRENREFSGGDRGMFSGGDRGMGERDRVNYERAGDRAGDRVNDRVSDKGSRDRITDRGSRDRGTDRGSREYNGQRESGGHYGGRYDGHYDDYNRDSYGKEEGDRNQKRYRGDDKYNRRYDRDYERKDNDRDYERRGGTRR